MAQVRILVADDHEVVRMGIKAMIQQHSNLAVIAEADNGDPTHSGDSIVRGELRALSAYGLERRWHTIEIDAEVLIREPFTNSS